MVVREIEGPLYQLVLVDQRSAKHGGVVGIERQHKALIEIAADGVLREFGAASGAQVTGYADFDWDLAPGEFFHQFGILPGCQSVADALHSQIQSAPDRVRPGDFSGMGGEMKTVFGGARIHAVKQIGRPFEFVAADAEASHVAIMEPSGEVEHALRLLRAELTDGIEDPQDRDAKIGFSALTAAFESLEKRREILLAPQADAHGNDNFGVKDVRGFQPLHEAVRDEFVVVGRAQVSGDMLESFEEAHEVGEVVQLFNFGERGASAFHAMALAEFEESGRLDRAFKMQMEFSLGESGDQRARRDTVVHTRIVVHSPAGFTLLSRRTFGELAVVTAVEHVDHQPKGQPDHESQPGDHGKTS